MYFYLIGIDYKSASLDIREAIYRKQKEISAFWQDYQLQEVAVLATCNRVEVYAQTKDFVDARLHACLFCETFRQFFYNGYTVYGNEDVFRHALRVASGLESQIKGESQILRQLEIWRQHLPLPLGSLWDKAMVLARDICLKAGLNREEFNIASIVFDDLVKNAKVSGQSKVIIVGTGKIAELFASSISRRAKLYFVANKNYLKAKELAKRSGGRALSFKELPEELSTADCLISATKSPHFVLGKNDFVKVLDGRERTLYLYDLAVPRDIEPGVGEIKGIVLKNLDDLGPIFNEKNARLKDGLDLAAYLVEEAVKNYKEVLNDEGFKTWHTAKPVGHKTS